MLFIKRPVTIAIALPYDPKYLEPVSKTATYKGGQQVSQAQPTYL